VPLLVFPPAVQQVAFADKLLLNKTDLVSQEELRQLETRLRAINGGAQILHCTYSQ
jgi:G3E family GTPase